MGALLLTVGLLFKESKWNNEEGELSPNSSGKHKIVSQKIGSQVQLEVPTGQ